MEKLNSLEIKEYLFEEEKLSEYFNFILSLYKGRKGIDIYVQSVARTLNFNNPFFKENKIWNFICYLENKIVGHISAIIDFRLFKKDKCGLIGFFESINDSDVSKELIQTAINRLKENGCRRVFAPVNLTIWHSYRFALNQNSEKKFYFEPINQPYYPDLFLNSGFKVLENYYSAQRLDFSTLLDFTKKDYLGVIQEGYRFRNLSSEEDLMSVYELSKKVFPGSAIYVDLTAEEFLYIYSDLITKFDKDLIEIISDKEGKDIGFSFSIVDPFNSENIILKTLGVIQEYRNKGVGASLLYSIHNKALRKDYKKFIYALIREDSVIKKLPYPGAEIISKYQTYILEI